MTAGHTPGPGGPALSGPAAAAYHAARIVRSRPRPACHARWWIVSSLLGVLGITLVLLLVVALTARAILGR